MPLKFPSESLGNCLGNLAAHARNIPTAPQNKRKKHKSYKTHTTKKGEGNGQQYHSMRAQQMRQGLIEKLRLWDSTSLRAHMKCLSDDCLK
jgi:hypothetical protein